MLAARRSRSATLIVPVHDLTKLRSSEVAAELVRPLLWLIACTGLAAAGSILAALAVSFCFFLAGLRLVHDAFHYNLSLPRWVTEIVIAALSAAMLGSMHAVQIRHLRHHIHCLGEEDFEGSSARKSAWGAILYGPRFTLELHRQAWLLGNGRQRKWMALELALTVILAAAVRPRWLALHVAAMVLGHCLTAFFAVWTVHHDCDDVTGIPARTLRSRWRSFVSQEMFFNLEHHSYPGVPTRRLARLASRLDAAYPNARRRQVW